MEPTAAQRGPQGGLHPEWWTPWRRRGGTGFVYLIKRHPAEGNKVLIASFRPHQQRDNINN